jgi:uncharacterized protein involved in cysteine biosynthesis
MLHGALAALQGFGFAFRHRNLWLLCLAAMLAYALVWLAALALATHLTGPFVHAHLAQPGPASWQQALWQLERAGIYLLAWLLAAALALVLALPLLSPLFSWLAARTERHYFGHDGEPLPGNALVEPVRALGRAVALSAIQLGGAILLWLTGIALGLIAPPVGSAFALLIGGGWNALWLTAVFIGFALDEHATPLSQQIKLLRQHAATWLGFGLVASVLAWLPPAVPFLVVSGSLLVCRLQAHGHLELRRRSGAVDRLPR